ncbi:GGDEF domain-containing protein [Pseudomonas mangrovi]|nr:GGDEF domain-containing protein [Pseudomonas mangrovi]
MSLDSAYLRQQRGGFRLLRFEHELEEAFARHHTRTFLRRMRWALLVATVLILLFAVLDASILPDGIRDKTLVLRLGVMLPVLLGTWGATFCPTLHPWMQVIGGFCALACGMAVAAIIWVSRSQNFPLPYEGIILVTVFFYFLIGLRCVTAVLCGWLVLVAYVMVELRAGLPGTILLYNAFFLATTNLIGSVGCYFLEYAARESFLAQGLLRELVEKDYLTGLLNRRAFSERAERHWRQALREQRKLAVVMMDIDYFKRYNDHYGHLQGDEALRAVAQVVGRHARRPLDCVARYGGEEFVGLWYGLDEARALALLESIRSDVQALDLPHESSEVASTVTLSIGMVHLLPHALQSLEDALRMADAALYLAKAQGRNRVVNERMGSQAD